MAGGQHHERGGASEEVKVPTERSFGVTFACVFALLSAWLFYRQGLAAWPVAIAALALAFLGLAYGAPYVLRPLNLLWLKFGLLLHRVVNPLIMGLLFFLVFTPMGVGMRLFGGDLLRLKRRPEEKSYWVFRAEENVQQSSMKNQF